MTGSLTAVSSLDTRRTGDSRIAGEGDSVGFGTSDSERDLLFLGVRLPSSCSSWLVRFDFSLVALVGAAIIVADMFVSPSYLHPNLLCIREHSRHYYMLMIDCGT